MGIEWRGMRLREVAEGRAAYNTGRGTGKKILTS